MGHYKVYLAASFSRKSEMCEVAKSLQAVGLCVVSRWLLETSEAGSSLSAEYLRHRALEDASDVNSCDILVRFSDDLRTEAVPSHLATGSRMVEMGMALAKDKMIIDELKTYIERGI